MNFETYWAMLIKAKPVPEGKVIKMSKDQFMKMQKQAFVFGKTYGDSGEAECDQSAAEFFKSMGMQN